MYIKTLKRALKRQFWDIQWVVPVFTYVKKIFSLTLILNSFITLTAIAGILYGFYFAWPGWKPYTPWLFSGDLFLVAGIAALINIFPSASIGRCLHTGRLWFHHYVYGFFVLVFSTIYVMAFTSVSLVSLFLVNTGSIPINAGRFFVLTGATLFLDDLPDVSKRIESTLNKIKSQACRVRKGFHVAPIDYGCRYALHFSRHLILFHLPLRSKHRQLSHNGHFASN